MEKTWISFLLPKDEYREKRMLYFITEAAFILLLLLFLYLSAESFITDLNIPGMMVALQSFVFLTAYITLRATLTGIEHPDVATEVRYKQQRREKISGSIIFWFIFIIASLIFKGFPSNWEEILDIVAPATIAAIPFLYHQLYFLKKILQEEQRTAGRLTKN